MQRSSDLLDCFVGGTEQNIARAFQNAKRDGAVLLLDEADSLLRGREHAHQSWEVTQVNELLSQLDGYSGVAILTTNHADVLDRALLRRIDVKLELQCLNPEATLQAFTATLAALGLDEQIDAVTSERISRLHDLTVGDLVAVLNGLRLRAQKPSVEQVLAGVECELRLKQGNQRAIGF